jgi:hypothetical protein
MINYTDVEYSIIQLGLKTVKEHINTQIKAGGPMVRHLQEFKDQVEQLQAKVDIDHIENYPASEEGAPEVVQTEMSV